MNSIPAQEIKRHGIAALDEALRHGPVHIIANNRPPYVVLSEEGFEELMAVQQEADHENLRASLQDLQAGRVERYPDVDSLMRRLDAGE
jgi:PHD/YefM family antitoxin component YafN of YafNO toxin-antitoxin module